ncbi:MAG: hypothetical protein Q4P23_14400 [Micrococcaceae bacterium]|nr:hypothetical protein [Micrococcaceae bacterium]
MLAGRWRIVEMDVWDREALDLVGPAFIEFTGDGDGEFLFVAVSGWLDCRPAEREGRPGVEFSWDGDDEGQRTNGRGWAAWSEDQSIHGHIFIHQGDDSAFLARPYDVECVEEER